MTNFAAAFLAQLGDAPSADLIAEALSHHFSAIVLGERFGVSAAAGGACILISAAVILRRA